MTENFSHCLGWKFLNNTKWVINGVEYHAKINVLKILEVSNNPVSEGIKSIRIEYKLPRGRKIYTMWVYPMELIDIDITETK
jgi:hypothetical protein